MHKLMIKTHNVTGLKYLCYTQREDHDTYLGSGTVWKRHIKKHGNDITTEVIYETDIYEEFVSHAKKLSDEYDVVGSDAWANLRPEEGTGGDTVSGKVWITDGVHDKYMSRNDVVPDGWRMGRTNTKFVDPEFQREMSRRRHSKDLDPSIMKEAAQKANETKRLRGIVPDIAGDKNPSKRSDVREKLRQHALSRPVITCPHCGKVGKASPGMYAFHFDNCKAK